MKKTDARIYLRISRPDESVILKNQRKSAFDHARRYDLKVVHPAYEDVASGGKSDRNGLNELLADLNPGEIVVFTSLSRMTRGGIGAALYTLGRLEAMRVGWHFIEQPMLNFDSTTPKLVKDILLAVLAAVDEDYRRRISEATKAAFKRRKALARSRGEKLRWGRPKRKKGSR